MNVIEKKFTWTHVPNIIAYIQNALTQTKQVMELIEMDHRSAEAKGEPTWQLPSDHTPYTDITLHDIQLHKRVETRILETLPNTHTAKAQMRCIREWVYHYYKQAMQKKALGTDIIQQEVTPESCTTHVQNELTTLQNEMENVEAHLATYEQIVDINSTFNIPKGQRFMHLIWSAKDHVQTNPYHHLLHNAMEREYVEFIRLQESLKDAECKRQYEAACTEHIYHQLVLHMFPYIEKEVTFDEWFDMDTQQQIRNEHAINIETLVLRLTHRYDYLRTQDAVNIAYSHFETQALKQMYKKYMETYEENENMDEYRDINDQKRMRIQCTNYRTLQDKQRIIINTCHEMVHKYMWANFTK